MTSFRALSLLCIINTDTRVRLDPRIVGGCVTFFVLWWYVYLCFVLMTNDLITRGLRLNNSNIPAVCTVNGTCHTAVSSHFSTLIHHHNLMQTFFCACSKNSKFRPEIFMVTFGINAVSVRMQNWKHSCQWGNPLIVRLCVQFPISIGVSWINIVFPNLFAVAVPWFIKAGRQPQKNEKNGLKGGQAFPCDP